MAEKITRITLLQRLRDRQDESSWTDFAHYYQPFIHAVLRQLGANTQDAEDLCQTVLVKAWKVLPEFQYRPGECQFRTWLGRICHHTINSEYRRRNTLRRSEPEHLEIALSSEPEIDAVTELEWQRYISDLAWKNIQGLFAENVRQSFLLAASGLNSTDIALRLGLAESSVRVNKSRVIAALCKEIVRLDNELLH